MTVIYDSKTKEYTGNKPVEMDKDQIIDYALRTLIGNGNLRV